MRHYINLLILYATLTEFRTVGPFELNWETEEYKSWIAQYIAFGLLGCLQAVNLFWLFSILRIFKNYVLNAVAADERSDNEEENEDAGEAVVEPEVEANKEAKRRIEGETGMKTDKPAVLLNGKPVNGEAHPEGIVERRKKR